jgi:hypothetical protein
MTIYKTRMDSCPACGVLFDQQGDVPGNTPDAPSPGDLTVCIECTAVLTFDDTLRVRILQPYEVLTLGALEREALQKTITSIRVVNASRARGKS